MWFACSGLGEMLLGSSWHTISQFSKNVNISDFLVCIKNVLTSTFTNTNLYFVTQTEKCVNQYVLTSPTNP